MLKEQDVLAHTADCTTHATDFDQSIQNIACWMISWFKTSHDIWDQAYWNSREREDLQAALHIVFHTFERILKEI